MVKAVQSSNSEDTWGHLLVEYGGMQLSSSITHSKHMQDDRIHACQQTTVRERLLANDLDYLDDDFYHNDC
jgi:hypothetical protein